MKKAPRTRKDGKPDGRSLREQGTYFFKDISGCRYGMLTAIRPVASSKDGQKVWLCRCDCGGAKTTTQGKLSAGRVTHCGCQTHGKRVNAASKHGITAGGKPRTFTIWNGMKARCFNPKSTSYKNYGGRGILVCDEWLNFQRFHEWAINNGYADGLQIDRIDNDAGYCPENCRWVPASQNRTHQRRTHYVSVNGDTRSVTEWCRLSGISKTTAYKALKSGDEAFAGLVNRFLSRR